MSCGDGNLEPATHHHFHTLQPGRPWPMMHGSNHLDGMMTVWGGMGHLPKPPMRSPTPLCTSTKLSGPGACSRTHVQTARTARRRHTAYGFECADGGDASSEDGEGRALHVAFRHLV